MQDIDYIQLKKKKNVLLFSDVPESACLVAVGQRDLQNLFC